MSYEERFDKSVHLVCDYINNSNEEPRKFEIYKGIYIARFIYKIRCIYNKGILLTDGSIVYETYILKKEHIDLLKENNFNFNMKTDLDNFKNKINALEDYLKENSWYSIKEDTMYKHIDIGNFVNYIRYIYKKGNILKDGSMEYFVKNDRKYLSKEKIELLNQIGFVWDKNKIEFTNEEDFNDKRKYLIINLNILLNSCKNDIKSKKDIDNINKKYIKKLD